MNSIWCRKELQMQQKHECSSAYDNSTILTLESAGSSSTPLFLQQILASAISCALYQCWIPSVLYNTRGLISTIVPIWVRLQHKDKRPHHWARADYEVHIWIGHMPVLSTDAGRLRGWGGGEEGGEECQERWNGGVRGQWGKERGRSEGRGEGRGEWRSDGEVRDNWREGWVEEWGGSKRRGEWCNDGQCGGIAGTMAFVIWNTNPSLWAM